jgi:hypothetical protein
MNLMLRVPINLLANRHAAVERDTAMDGYQKVSVECLVPMQSTSK